MRKHPQNANFAHSPTPSTPLHPALHQTVCRYIKARAPCNGTPAFTHKCNRADTTEHHAHNGPPDPTPRWDNLTRQEVSGQQHTPTPAQTPMKRTTPSPSLQPHMANGGVERPYA
ncbi:hypothetical protein CRENBAI_012735 [Crenichthys baileyi]|uniref:Uncharacterized protein n=1 Tax=Crenichthys baileyi TaxID=28760 RepID=A0AAV9SL45_9TELE